jgi:signal transduction histidine kinase
LIPLSDCVKEKVPTSTIKRVEDVTRLETQTLELKKEQFSLNDVILHAMNDIMSSREFSSKNLQLSYEPHDILLQADKSRIAEVISNLLSNAVKWYDNY